MTAPVIHSMGRILFQEYTFGYVRVDFLSEIPNGPQMDERHVEEGAALLLANPEMQLPPLLVVEKDKRIWDREYWVIEGRHRRASYALADRLYAPVIKGEGMIILPKLDTV